VRWRRAKREESAQTPATTAQASGPTEDHGADRPATEDHVAAEPVVVDTPRAPAPPQVPLDLAEFDDEQLERARTRAVARALAEDLGDRGDVTSLATIPPGTTGTAQLVARADGVVAGLDLVREAFTQVDTRVDIQLLVADGDRVVRGDILGDIVGSLRSILTAERTALNFLTHLSGIATSTRALVDAVEGTGCHVRDTRKTLPGLRLLEKQAVRTGGGHNHRIGLHDVLLVKDNHVAAAGSVTAAVEGALAGSHGLHVQVEVASMEELAEALDAGATDVLLDNFTPDEVAEAVIRSEGRASFEASGNIDLGTIRAYADAGVHRVAVGRITHSAPALDIALDVRNDDVAPPSWAAGASDPDRDAGPPAEDA